MTSELVVYVCPNCGHPVSFYAGFNMECKTKQGNPSHGFTTDKGNDNG